MIIQLLNIELRGFKNIIKWPGNTIRSWSSSVLLNYNFVLKYNVELGGKPVRLASNLVMKLFLERVAN